MCRVCRWTPMWLKDSLSYHGGRANPDPASGNSGRAGPASPRIVPRNVGAKHVFLDRRDSYGVRSVGEGLDGYGLEAGSGSQDHLTERGGLHSSGAAARLCPFCGIPVKDPPFHDCSRCGTTIPPDWEATDDEV